MSHLVVVEDDPVARSLLQRIMQKEGHTVACFDAISSAWGHMTSEVMIDAVIIDVQLHNETGLSLLVRMRQHLVFQNCPAIICSSHNERKIVLKALELGATAYLLKPYKAEELRRTVTRSLTTQRFGDMFGTMTDVCVRLDLTPAEYQATLLEASDMIANAHERLIGIFSGNTPEDERHVIGRLNGLALNLDFAPLKEVCIQLKTTRDEKVREKNLHYLPMLARLVRERGEQPLPSTMDEDNADTDRMLPVTEGDEEPDDNTDAEVGLPPSTAPEARTKQQEESGTEAGGALPTAVKEEPDNELPSDRGA